MAFLFLLKLNFIKTFEFKKYLKKENQFSKLIVYGIGQCFNLITPLLVVPYIVNCCGVENYGKISIAMAICFFLMVFVDYGSDIVGVKEVSVNRENKVNLEQIFITTYFAKLVLLLIIIAFFSIMILSIPFFKQDYLLYFLGIPILIGQFLNPTWFLQGVENFKWITILTIVSKIIYLSFIFIFIHEKEDFILVNLGWGIGTILANLIAFYMLFKEYSFSFSNTDMKNVKKLLSKNFSIFSSQIFVSLQMYAPIMLIGFFSNSLLAGYYKIVEQIIVIFKTYIFLFFNFVYPRVCFLLEKNSKEGVQFWKKYNGINFVFILVSMIVVLIFSEQIVSYFTEVHTIEISNLLKIATLIPILLSISIPLKQLILGFDLQKKYVTTTMITVFANLIMIIILLPNYQIIGVISSLIFVEFLTILIYIYFLRNKSN